MADMSGMSNGTAERRSAEVFSQTAFDFIVIGGGNAGLPLAVRLSENLGWNVGVIEAGLHQKGDPLIDMPGFLGLALGKPNYDWSFSTIPQPGAHGRVIPAARGKMLGGSTGLNYMAWDRASNAEYDAWKLVSAEPGDAPEDAWDWNGLLPYFKKSETVSSDDETPDLWPGFSVPEHVVRDVSSEQEFIGDSGPIKASHNVVHTDVHPHFTRGWNQVGVHTNASPFAGNPVGVYTVRRAVDPKTGVRSYAANSYYAPVADRPNLKIITGALATKINFSQSRRSDGQAVATGVSFIVDGTEYLAKAAKDVILCAGPVQSPQLLELSGIGSAEILGPLGISILENLPAVGENMQDHIFAPAQYIAKPGVRTLDELSLRPEYMAEQQTLYGETKGGLLAAIDSSAVFLPLRASVSDADVLSALLVKLEHAVAEADAEGALTPLQKKNYEIQMQWIMDGTIPQTEHIMFSRTLVPLPATGGRNGFALMAGIQHPFSRGSVHITDSDATVPPAIDPKYLSWDYDVEAISASYRLMEKMAETSAMQEVIETRVIPSVNLDTGDLLENFIRQAFTSGSHLMGTCAMARKDLGGVVSSRLKVYGTSNLRVVDSSIIPTPLACHIQSTTYAIAEKAAAMIVKDWS